MDDDNALPSSEVAAEPAASDPASLHAHPNLVADLRRGAEYLIGVIEKAPTEIKERFDELKAVLEKHAV